MASIVISGRDLRAGRRIDVPTDEANIVVVKRLKHYLVEVEDARTGADRRLVLACDPPGHALTVAVAECSSGYNPRA